MNSTPRFALSNLSNFKAKEFFLPNIQAKNNLFPDLSKPLNDTPFQPKNGLNIEKTESFKEIIKEVPIEKKFGSSYEITEAFY